MSISNLKLFDRRLLKSLVSTAYQLQKQRIAMGLRLVATIKHKLGQAPGKSEGELDDEAKQMLTELRLSYNRISDALASRVKKNGPFPDDGLITDEAEYCMARVYFMLLQEEEYTFSCVEDAVKHHPMYPWFQKVSGVGSTIAAVLLSQVNMDPEVTPNLGHLYAYAGLDVVIVEKENEDGTTTLVGEARSRKAHHLIDRTYIDRDGNEQTRKSLTYNDFLHTKLLGVCADCLVKAGGYFKTEVFNSYKFRLLNEPSHLAKTDAHINKMAKRYMVKIFLMYFFEEYCRVVGRELPDRYHEKKLNLFHSGNLFEADVKRTKESLEEAREAADRIKVRSNERKKERQAAGFIIAGRRVTKE